MTTARIQEGKLYEVKYDRILAPFMRIKKSDIVLVVSAEYENNTTRGLLRLLLPDGAVFEGPFSDAVFGYAFRLAKVGNKCAKE